MQAPEPKRLWTDGISQAQLAWLTDRVLDLAEQGTTALTDYDCRVLVGERLWRLARATLPPDSWRLRDDERPG